MECEKCEESGLLFVSGELPPAEKSKFEAKIAACTDPQCSIGYKQYARERKALYSMDHLADAPSRSVDEKIVLAASKYKVKYTGFMLFSSFIKKSAFPLAVLIIGLAGGYLGVSNTSFFSHGHNSSPLANKEHRGEGLSSRSTSVGVATTIRASQAADSAIGDTNHLPYSKRVGNAGDQGAIAVGVEK